MAGEFGTIDRRKFSLGCIAVLTAACAKVPNGNAKSGGNWWADFCDRFVLPAGRVIDNGNGNISHSEGQGYGMLLAVISDDRKTFANLARWTAENLQRTDMALHAWKYDPRQPDPVADRNNATDGDILIAWALSRAAQRWQMPEYGQRARDIRRAIRSHLVAERGGRLVILPGLVGFSDQARQTVNPSYYIWSALDAFAELDGEAIWGPVIDDGTRLMIEARFGPRAMPVDWLDIDNAGKLTPAHDRPARFGFDAIRIPLYATAGRRAALADTAVVWWRSFDKAGKPIPAWIDVLSGEVAPYPLAPGATAMVDRALGRPVRQGPLAQDYYPAVLQMLARDLR